MDVGRAEGECRLDHLGGAPLRTPGTLSLLPPREDRTRPPGDTGLAMHRRKDGPMD